jgi:DNA invertase Pin-like site-specific DNA recombinase
MDRFARKLGDLLHLVQSLTAQGVAVEFVRGHLIFIGEDAPVAMLMLSVMGAVAEFERTLIRERQREGIALAKQRGVYRGPHRSRAAASTATALTSCTAYGLRSPTHPHNE